MQELLLVNPSQRMSNPRRRRRRSGRGSAKQIAWRKKFAAMYGGGGKRRANPKKRRRARFGATMRSIARKGGGAVSRSTWRSSGYRRNPRRRRYRRNPAFGPLRLPSMGGVMKTVTEAGQGAIGATLVDLVMGQLSSRNWLPGFAYTDLGYPLIKGAIAIGTAAVAEAFVPRPFKGIAAEMAKGSITITLAGVIRQFMPATLPMGARRSFGYGSPGYIPSGRPRAMAGVGEYLSGPSEGSMSMREMEAYGPGYVATGIGEYLSR